MQNKLRLAVVEPNNGGGLIHYTYQLCTALAGAGVDVTLITGTEYELADYPHNFRVEKILQLWEHFDQQPLSAQTRNSLTRHFVRLQRLLRRAVRGGRLVMAWLTLASRLVRLKPDIIQFTRIEFPFEALFIKYLRRRGFVLTQICHEFESRESQGLFSSLLLRLTGDAYINFSAIFFHARENHNRFLSLYPDVPERLTHVIPHGNSRWLLEIPSRPVGDMREYLNLHKDESVVLFFGLLAPSKGVEDLIDAFAVASRSCSAKLIIAGYPTKHININELRARVESHGLADKVIFDLRYIPLEEISPLMNLATVVVYPYRSSTQSGALQAAYIFSRPVIATAVGGLPEAVEDGRSGFIVPPESPQALAEKIVQLVNDPDLANQMGAYARHLADTRFSWEAIAGQVVSVYKDLQKTAPVSSQE